MVGLGNKNVLNSNTETRSTYGYKNNTRILLSCGYILYL